MSRSLRFTDFAKENIRALPHDSQLLDTLFGYLEDAADDPDRYTERGAANMVLPHLRVVNAEIYDLAGKPWQFVVVVAVTDEALEVRTVRYVQRDWSSGFES